MDAEERIQAVSQFLLQSPPGEINDVLNGTVDPLSYIPRSRSTLTRCSRPPRRRTRAHRGRRESRDGYPAGAAAVQPRAIYDRGGPWSWS
jgi:hypothetical protein